MAELKDDYSVEIVEKNYYYSTSYTPTSIKPVPGAWVEVDAPPAAGSGLELGFKPIPETLANSEIDLYYGGAGYYNGKDTSFYIPFSPGVNGDTSELWVEVSEGKIIDYNLFSNGATYDIAPTIDLDVLGGTGAILDINFDVNYNVYIIKRGTGFLYFPSVSYSYYSDSEFGNLITSTIQLRDYARIKDGKIYADDLVDGDTLFQTGQALSVPEYEIIYPEGIKALISIDNSYITDLGLIDNYYVEEYGAGYDATNPPKVTIHAVNGKGSGAKIIAGVNIDQNGELDLDLANNGSGYQKNVNDFTKDKNYPTSSFNQYPETPFNYVNWYDVSPGEELVRNIYYGTGKETDINNK